MRSRVRGVVQEVTAERAGAQELLVHVGTERRRAINYPALTGPVEPGQSVVLNTWAVEMGLGTGGCDFVVAGGDTADIDAPGHVMKLRYTPLQHPVLAAEAPESPYHDTLREPHTLDAIPVVCAELHSQVPAICAAAKWETGGAARIVYVMTDGAALPIALSRLVPELRERGLIDATVTAGQAFGGDFEAINIYSALAVAHAAAGADVIVVSQGPGNAGTDTAYGFSGIDQGISLNAAAALDGTAIAVVRLGFSDPRPRHVGISHHTRTVLERVALCPVLVPVPRLPHLDQLRWRAMLEESGLFERHEFVTVDADQGLQALVDSGIEVTTMGRTVEDERAFFLSAAAAGLLAGQWVAGTLRSAEVI